MPNRWIESALHLLFPPVCEICEEPRRKTPGNGPCERCRSRIAPITGPHCPMCGRTADGECASCGGERFHYDRLFACSAYEGTMKELLHRYKFNGRKSLKYFFANLLSETAERCLPEKNFDAVLSVPAEPGRLNERGFNPASLVAERFAEKSGRPHLGRVLLRRREGASQRKMRKDERRINVHGQFFVAAPEAVAGKNLLLIDDIVTTGHTASECARVLKSAGAKRVAVLALARGL